MGALKTVKDGLKALVVAAVPSDVTVVVGMDPAEIDDNHWSRYVSIVLQSAISEPSTAIADNYQEEAWIWDLYVGIGAGGTDEDKLDQVDTVLAALVTGLLDQSPESANSGRLELRTLGELVSSDAQRIVYRQEWYHYRCTG